MIDNINYDFVAYKTNTEEWEKIKNIFSQLAFKYEENINFNKDFSNITLKKFIKEIK